MAQVESVLTREHGTSLAIGRPRLTALHCGVLSPWCPTSFARHRLSPATEGQGTFTLGPVLGREAAIQGLPGPRSAKPRAQAPLPIHAQIRSAERPSVDEDG